MTVEMDLIGCVRVAIVVRKTIIDTLATVGMREDGICYLLLIY